ncbi:MAG: glycosyltransferase [Verrucomicrobiota bacterium]
MNWILGSLAVLSCGLTLWQWLAARRFPLHQPITNQNFSPPITLLKPLKGCDAETKESLQSWFTQEYSSPIQILFGVASTNDPVCELVEKLIRESPKFDAKLIVCSESLGPNAKISTLIQLEHHAQNEILIISDADVRVPKDFLANIVQPFGVPPLGGKTVKPPEGGTPNETLPLNDSSIGLVNCFYRLANPSTTAMQWEAIAINADFWSQVLQSQTLKPLDFALGAAMATRREQLKQIGGFESLVDFLADDYQLGNKIARTGKQIVLSPVVVECWESPMNWKRVWSHQLRWARTIRVCQPVPFFFSILSNATLWPLLWTATLLAEHHRIWFVPISILLPIRIQAALKMQEWLTLNMRHYTYFWFVPIKDLLNAFIWALAFVGNRIEWRGEKFRVLPGGRLKIVAVSAERG